MQSNKNQPREITYMIPHVPVKMTEEKLRKVLAYNWRKQGWQITPITRIDITETDNSRYNQACVYHQPAGSTVMADIRERATANEPIQHGFKEGHGQSHLLILPNPAPKTEEEAREAAAESLRRMIWRPHEM